MLYLITIISQVQNTFKEVDQNVCHLGNYIGLFSRLCSFQQAHPFIQKKNCPCYLLYYFYYSNELLVSLGVIKKIDESILQQNNLNWRTFSLFFTDHKRMLFLNGSTDPISAGTRYDKLLLDLNNNYVL